MVVTPIGDPNIPKATSLNLFLSKPMAVEDPKIMRLLDLHSALNSVIYHLMAVQVVVFKWGVVPDNFKRCGVALRALDDKINDAFAQVRAAKVELADLPLRVTVHNIDQWLVTTARHSSLCFDFIVNGACVVLNSCTEVVDQLCPKWGSCVSDTSLNLEMAIVMLVQNANITRLRTALNDLWSCISAMGEFSSHLGVGPVTEWPATREWIRLAYNSLNFGKDTLKITAAIKTISEKNIDDVPVLMKHSQSFPQALIDKLHDLAPQTKENTAAEHLDLNPNSGSKDKNAGLKRKCSSFDHAETATTPTTKSGKKDKVKSSRDRRGSEGAGRKNRGGEARSSRG